MNAAGKDKTAVRAGLPVRREPGGAGFSGGRLRLVKRNATAVTK